MEQEFENTEPMSEDLYAREEKCLKAIRVVRKALFMRVIMAALMVWVVLNQPGQPIVLAVAVFVLLIIGIGAWPLVQEWRKQRRIFRELVAQEE